MYLDIWIDILENIKMNNFSDDYENLKNQLNDDKGKLIGYLFAGLITVSYTHLTLPTTYTV